MRTLFLCSFSGGHVSSQITEKRIINPAAINEGREGGVTIPFPTRNFPKITVPVGLLLKIPVEVIKIPVNKK